MLYYDNFHTDDVLKEALDHAKEKGFEKVQTGDLTTPGDKIVNKSFVALLPTKTLESLHTEKISLMMRKPIKHIFSFIRRATDEEDTDWRIHADTVIMGQQPTHAAVWYMSEKPQGLDCGTAFWSHHKHGIDLDPSNVMEFNRILTEDANKKELFELDGLVGYKQNRVVIYRANRFHSKYPNKAWKDGRIVLATFFKID